MLKLQNVKQVFNETRITYPDWGVQDGEQALILGTSGSGKTTLLHLACGLLQPTEGSISLAGVKLDKMNTGKLDRFRGENVGLVFQKPHLVKSLNVEQNVLLAGKFSRKKISNERLSQVLQGLGIENLAKRKIHELSEGQLQRVSIARAIIHEPKLLAADEPTASLDDENCEKVIGLLKSQAEANGATLLIATHDQRVKNHFSNQLTL